MHTHVHMNTYKKTICNRLNHFIASATAAHLPSTYIFFKALKGKRKTSCLQPLYQYVCMFDHCLTSNTAEIKAQNKCCENKSPRAETRDHAQDTDGVWDGKKKTWRGSKCGRAARVCVWKVCLKWPCVSSSLEGSRSCVESRPVSSLCSCCSVMLLALDTQTHSSVLTAGNLSARSPCTLGGKKLFVFVSEFGYKESYSPKFYEANKWTLSSKSTQRWCNIQSLTQLAGTTVKISSLQK